MDPVIHITDLRSLYKRVFERYDEYKLKERDVCKLVDIGKRMSKVWENLKLGKVRELSNDERKEIRTVLTRISEELQELNLYYVGRECKNQVLADCKSFTHHKKTQCKNNNTCAQHEIKNICASLTAHSCAPAPVLRCEGKSFQTITIGERSVEATVQDLLQYSTFPQDEMTQDQVNALAEDIFTQDKLQDI